MLTNPLTVTRCVVDALLQVYVLIQRNFKSIYTRFPSREKESGFKCEFQNHRKAAFQLFI